MSRGANDQAPAQEPALHLYTLLCLAALGLVLVLLIQRRFHNLSLLPTVVGVLAVAFRWRSGPLLYLATLTGVLLLQYADVSSRWFALRAARTAQPSDWLLCAAVLGFVHPRTEKPLRFEEPPPADFAAVLERLRNPTTPVIVLGESSGGEPR